MSCHDQLTRLPLEIYDHIISDLDNAQKKNLRLTCTVLRFRTPLRLERVFLSANPRNVEVFCAIADHDVFRRGITEIIWDDACLPGLVERHADHPINYEAYHHGEGIMERETCPTCFARSCQENIDEISNRKGPDGDLPQHLETDKQVEAQLPLEVSFAYYQGLLLQQQSVLSSQADVDALRYGIARFPALRRVTITPATHGVLYSPLYQTPMIRAFPYGFNFPIPRGWPTMPLGHSPPYDALPWGDETQNNRWRGFSIVLRALAEEDHRVSELAVDVNGLCTGMNPHVFHHAEHEEYRDFVALLQRPGFSRLDLALLVARHQDYGWPIFLRGHFRRALSEARGLQHISLCTDLASGQEFEIFQSEAHEIRLQAVCPVDAWQDLRHFGLRGFVIRQSDLISFLASMPPSLRSVELSFLRFYGSGNCRSLLFDMRDQLGWHDRPTSERPKVVVGVESWLETVVGRAVWLEDEISHFLYNLGPNPFGSVGDPSPHRVQLGFGIERDEFDPTFEKPWVDGLR